MSECCVYLRPALSACIPARKGERWLRRRRSETCLVFRNSKNRTGFEAKEILVERSQWKLDTCLHVVFVSVYLDLYRVIMKLLYLLLCNWQTAECSCWAAQLDSLSYVYGSVHHLDSWIKRNQLDATYFIIYSIFIECSLLYIQYSLNEYWIYNKEHSMNIEYIIK